MISKVVELHHILRERFPQFTGVTRYFDGKIMLTWESPPSKDMEDQANLIVDNFDWTETAPPTEEEVDSKIKTLPMAAKQALIEKMLKEYLLDRPDLVKQL